MLIYKFNSCQIQQLYFALFCADNVQKAFPVVDDSVAIEKIYDFDKVEEVGFEYLDGQMSIVRQDVHHTLPSEELSKYDETLRLAI